MGILLNIVLVIYVLVAVLMVFVILMQRPKSEGLGAAFGGGVTDNIFGAQTTNVLTKFTGWLAGIFFFLTFILSILYAHRGGASSELKRELMKDSPSAAMPIANPGAPVNPAPPAAAGGEAIQAPTGDMSPAGAAPAQSPNAADMAVGAVRPAVPPMNQAVEPPPLEQGSPAAPAASPAGSP